MQHTVGAYNPSSLCLEWTQSSKVCIHHVPHINSFFLQSSLATDLSLLSLSVSTFLPPLLLSLFMYLFSRTLSISSFRARDLSFHAFHLSFHAFHASSCVKGMLFMPLLVSLKHTFFAFSPSLLRSHSLSITLSLLLSHTHSLTYIFSLFVILSYPPSFSYTHTHSLSLSLSFFLSLSLTHTHTIFHSFPLSRPPASSLPTILSQPLSLSLSFSFTLSLSLSHTHTQHTHAHSIANLLAVSLSVSIFFSLNLSFFSTVFASPCPCPD